MIRSFSATFTLTIFLFCLSCCLAPPGFTQTTGQAQINWEVTNRFRLFAEQKDFDIQVAAWQIDTISAGKSIFETERTLQTGTKTGWSSKVGRLCYDRAAGEILTKCLRDNKEENYLSPDNHLIKLKVTLPPEFSSAQCTWTIGELPTATPFTRPCSEVIADQRIPDKKQTAVHVVATAATGRTIAADAAIEARDILIVGLGDSIASGDGNPDIPVALSDTGFCFERVLDLLNTRRFYLPGRAKPAVDSDCADDTTMQVWSQGAAGWLFTACHRSLYSYQTRAALALAIENPNISVTFIPLGCTGATIAQGLLAPQDARERPYIGGTPGPKFVGGQLKQLAGYLGVTSIKPPSRPIDLIFLTIGANDVGFSGLVADVMVTQNPERRLLAENDLLVPPSAAVTPLKVDLKTDFAKLRSQLGPFVDGDLSRVVFVTYADPARHMGGQDCPSTSVGFDAHPAFAVDGAELRKVVDFVENQFLPTLKTYATCDGATAGCGDDTKLRMTYVADHQAAFADHGFCAASASDPEFDRLCFRNGGSFDTAENGLTKPLACSRSATEFRPYADRARWIRTANDSYFAAMTYAWDARSIMGNPDYIHDGRWGLTSVVYGGVLHPTAEGHAAMADAALVAATARLKIPHDMNALSFK
jgi:hypothetical protein